jgi:hypothetical protein
MNTYKPFPVGTVRGPYSCGKSVQYLVNGKGGWVPFIDEDKHECERRANAYSVEVLAKQNKTNRKKKK